MPSFSHWLLQHNARRRRRVRQRLGPLTSANNLSPGHVPLETRALMDLHLDEGLGSIPNRFALLVERYQKLLSVHICEHALPNPKPRCIFGLSTHRLCFACAQICLLRSLRDLRRALAFKCSVVSAPPSVTDEGPLPLILLPVPAGAHVAQSLCQEQAHMRRFTDRYSASRRNPPPPPL